MWGDGKSVDAGNMEQQSVISGAPGAAGKPVVNPAYPPGRSM